MYNSVSLRSGDINLPGDLYFATSNRFVEEVLSEEENVEDVLCELSSREVLMILHSSKEADEYNGYYEIFTHLGMLGFVQTDEGDLLLVTYRHKTFWAQNRALRDGICLHIGGHVYVTVRYWGEFELYGSYCNGRYRAYAVDDPYCDHRTADELMDTLERLADEVPDADDESIAEDSAYKASPRLSLLLDQAYNYAELGFQNEQRVALAIGRIPYHDIRSVDRERVDRVCYELVIDELREDILQMIQDPKGRSKNDNLLSTEDVFRKGTSIDLKDRNDRSHTAEVVGTRRLLEEGMIGVQLLFAQQIDINQFPRTGTLALSMNTVNRDVQENAIERIRTGQAAAQYMNDVLGRWTPAGFEDKDLQEVDAALQAQEFPPNDSQMQAIHQGINTKDVYLVMGPPGTGKTTVILEWVKYFVRHEHLRVLVSSQNNKAVDNVLERLAREEGINTIRIGSELKLQANVLPFMFENRVTALRHQIADDTATNLAVLKRMDEHWRGCLEQLTRLLADIEQAEGIRTRIVDALQGLAAEYHTMEGLMSHYLELAAANQEYVERLRKRENAIAVMQQQTGYKQTLANMSMWLAVWLRDQEEILLQSVIPEQNAALAAYQEERVRYLQQYSSVRDMVAEYLRIKAAIEGAYRDLRPLEPDPKNIWQLFDKIPEIWQQIHIDGDILTRLLSDAKWHLEYIYANAETMIRAITDELGHLDQILTIARDWRQQTEDFQNYAFEDLLLEMVDLVGATCIGINSRRRFANLQFDVTIIDEAGQIQIHNALVPMSVSNKLIMLGDYQQIPPMADQELLTLCKANNVKTDLLEMSLFERMYQRLPESNRIMLDTQYRMPAEIAETISKWFYNGEYLSSEHKMHLQGMIPQLSERPYVIINTSDAQSRYETKTDMGCWNDLEAEIIAAVLKNMLQNTTDPDAIYANVGIISAYSAQVTAIKRRLNRFIPGDRVNEMAATLDSYQGQERDLIFYSYTRSSGKPADKVRIGFLNELRRLNVAMSRCKKTLVMVGDMDFLASCDNVSVDPETGESNYDKSERRFSEFIRLMLQDVRGGAGEILSYKEFCARMNISAERTSIGRS